LKKKWEYIIDKDKGNEKGVKEIMNSGVVNKGMKERELSV
jgi:hypothetical protein